MQRFRFFLLLLGFIVSLTGTSRAQKSGDADSQLWSETRLTYKLSDQFAVFTAGSYRLTDNFSDFSRVSARFGGTWAATPSFSVTPSYYYTVANPWTSSPGPENRACLLLAYRIPVKSALVTLANTTEYRMPEGGTNTFYLRPRVRVAHPVGPVTWGLDAFTANELFYNNNRGVFTQDRVFAGFEKKFNDTFNMSVYYCRRIAMNTTSSDANAICVGFAISFGRQKDNPPQVLFR